MLTELQKRKMVVDLLLSKEKKSMTTHEISKALGFEVKFMVRNLSQTGYIFKDGRTKYNTIKWKAVKNYPQVPMPEGYKGAGEATS